MLFAEPGAGKSYLAAEIATSIILNRKVLDQWNTRPTTGIVLYIAAETDNDVNGRYFRIAARFKVGKDVFKDRFRYLNGDVDKVKIDDRDWVAEIAALYLHKYEALGQLPDLIIIDTFRTATATGVINENDIPQISRIIANVKMLCKALGNAACLLIHHTNRGKVDYSGAGSFESDCPVLLFLQQSKEGIVSIFSRKNKFVPNKKKAIILAAKFVQNVKDGLLEPYDPSSVPVPNDELETDFRYEFLSVIQDNSPLRREIKNLLVSKHTKEGTKPIMNRCTRALSYLLKKEYISSSLEIDNEDTKLTITTAGEAAMAEYEDSGGLISEEELA
ncbi:MAG: AAA family ATPase [Caldilineaceae bacterium]|nr:AAA family ATPase [Caldilineaceae bacterium]